MVKSYLGNTLQLIGEPLDLPCSCHLPAHTCQGPDIYTRAASYRDPTQLYDQTHTSSAEEASSASRIWATRAFCKPRCEGMLSSQAHHMPVAITSLHCVKLLAASHAETPFWHAEGVTDAALVAFALRRVRASATFLEAAEALQRKFLRLVCRIMGRGEAATRIQAFLLLRQMATSLPDPMPSNALKVLHKPCFTCPTDPAERPHAWQCSTSAAWHRSQLGKDAPLSVSTGGAVW